MMHTLEMPADLVAIFREELGNPEFEPTASMTTDDVPGWDSAAMVGILMAIEETLGVELDANEVRKVGSIGDLAQLMERHRP